MGLSLRRTTGTAVAIFLCAALVARAASANQCAPVIPEHLVPVQLQLGYDPVQHLASAGAVLSF